VLLIIGFACNALERAVQTILRAKQKKGRQRTDLFWSVALAARRAWRIYRPKPRDSASPSFDGYALSSCICDDETKSPGADAKKKAARVLTDVQVRLCWRPGGHGGFTAHSPVTLRRRLSTGML
jgi:hypothetical protein